jgi:hypothetical protein
MMPRKLRHPKIRFDILSDDQKVKLLHGFDFAGEAFPSDEIAGACWRQFRDQLMEEWLAETKNAGRRPWGWWRFESVGERRRLGGVGTPARERSDCPDWARKVSYGMPGVFAEDYSMTDPPRFESETAYLRRHGLLSDEERRRFDVEGTDEDGEGDDEDEAS